MHDTTAGAPAETPEHMPAAGSFDPSAPMTADADAPDGADAASPGAADGNAPEAAQPEVARSGESTEPATAGEPAIPDPWQGTPAGDAWPGVPGTDSWRHPGTEMASGEPATSSPEQADTSETPPIQEPVTDAGGDGLTTEEDSETSWAAADDPRLTAWGGAPAGDAAGEFAAAPQTAPGENGISAAADADDGADATDRAEAEAGEGGGLEMERFPSDARSPEPDAAETTEAHDPAATSEATEATEATEAIDAIDATDAGASSEAPKGSEDLTLDGPESAEPSLAEEAADEPAGTESPDASESSAFTESTDEIGTVPVPIGETVLDSTDDETTGFDAGTDTAEPVSQSLDATTDQAPEEDSTPVATTATQAPPRHVELGLSDDEVLAMYRQMLLARAVDERMWLLQRAGRIAFVISGQGHEGAQVAIAWPLRKGYDWMAPYYRSVASVMTFGMTSEEIIAAHLAKADDPSSGGRQMPGHYGGAAYNIISTSSPVGTQALHATGIAMGAWVRGDDVVAITYFGEGTSNQGEVHEAMNFAGVHKLPVIFVCENNGYAISVPVDKQVGGGSVAIRAEGYGFPGVTVDGTDVLECYEVAREAIDRARRGEGPTLIEAQVVRLTSHSSDDDQRRYRDPAEMTVLTERDPIVIFGRELREIGLLTDEVEAQMRAEIKQEINDASRAAEARPDPDAAAAERWVYAADDASGDASVSEDR